MRKINLGCGGNRLNDWENHDLDIDITKPLPFDTNSIDFIFAEHVLEHLTTHQAYNFIENSWEILKPGGALKLVVPTILRITENESDYLTFIRNNNWGDGSYKSAVKALIFNHGHNSLWSVDLLLKILNSIGFDSYEMEPDNSKFNDLKNICGHQNAIGKKFNDLESICVEGIKHL